MADISVALEALRSDARVWDQAADNLSGPRSAIDPLELTPFDVMCFAANAGLDRLYNETRIKLQDMVGQAAGNFHNVAGALRQAADTYERDEEQRKKHIKRAGH